MYTQALNTSDGEDRNVEAEERVRQEAEKLEQFYDHIMSVRVVIARPQHTHHKGDTYSVRLHLTVPGAEDIAVSRDPAVTGRHEDIQVTISDAFDAARRQLQDFVRKRQGHVKAHEIPPHGIIRSLVSERDHGFIASADGREIYFHRNSVADGKFDGLEVGQEVRGFDIGDRVSGEGHITCGHCRNCRAGRRHLCRNTVGVGVNRDGCFAEYMSLPASNIFKLPAVISDEIASILDPLGNALTRVSFYGTTHSLRVDSEIELETLPAEKLSDVQRQLSSTSPLLFGPVVDGHLIPTHPYDPVAPAMSEHEAPVASQRCHTYVYVVGLPDHWPSDVVSLSPTCAARDRTCCRL